MATTIASSTLKVTVTENITLNGVAQGSTSVVSIPSIAEISKRIVTITTTEASILTFSTAVAPGTYIIADVRYIRLTNLDDTNHITLTFVDESNNEFKVKLDALQSFIFNADISGGVAETMIAATGAASDTLKDLASITADADTASCDLEVFVACA